MRYLFLVLSALIAHILSAALSPNLPILGVQIDFILLELAGIIFFEDSLSSIWYTMIGVFVMDIFFARTYGFYALQYTVASVAFFLVSRGRKKRVEYFETALAVSYLVRELTGVVACFLSDNPVSLFGRMLHVSLKGLVIHAVIGLLVFFIYMKAYELRLIRPTNLDID